MSSPKCRAAIPRPRSCSSAAISTAGTRAPARSTTAPGVAITTAAAKQIMDAGRPLRTIRVVWFGAEEPGGFGGTALAKAHARDRYAIAGESDFGADRIWRFSTQVREDAIRPIHGSARGRARAARHRPGTTRRSRRHRCRADDRRPARRGSRLSQDGTRYFDYHHTPDDTLDKIDPAQLRQNVAAWTAVLAILSGGIEPEPKRRQAALSAQKEENRCASYLLLPAPAARRLPGQQGRCQQHHQRDLQQDVAANAAADVGNTVENIAADIGNEAKATGDKIENKVGDTRRQRRQRRQRPREQGQLAARLRQGFGG